MFNHNYYGSTVYSDVKGDKADGHNEGSNSRAGGCQHCYHSVTGAFVMVQ